MDRRRSAEDDFVLGFNTASDRVTEVQHSNYASKTSRRVGSYTYPWNARPP